MGNTHAFYYRLPALFAASFASCALGLLAISGSQCDFVEVLAKDGHLLYIPDATEPPTATATYLGVICVNPLYEDILGDDLMFMLSRICLFVALAMGSFTCVLSWALSTFLTPTEANWKILSVFSAMTAVLQLPVFLIFETDPCTAFASEQECFLSAGSIYLMISTAFWIIVTIATQFLDPPRWADELNAWRTKNTQTPRDPDGRDGESQAPLLLPKKTGMIGSVAKWADQRRWAASAELPKNQTDSLSIGEDEELQRTEVAKYFAQDDSSNLVLNVLPSGKRPGDETKSVQSFEDLDSIVQMVEEGRLLDSPKGGESTQSDQNLQLVVWDKLKAEERSDRKLVRGIYNDLEHPKPVLETQITVRAAPPVSQFALPLLAVENATVDNGKQKGDKTFSTIKSPSVIRNFTENLKRSRVRRPRKINSYALMDDDDSSYDGCALPPSEVIIRNNDSDSLPELPGTPTAPAHFSFSNSRSLSLDDEYPDPVLQAMESNESTTDEEPDPIISSTYSHELDEFWVDDGVDSDSDVSSESDSSSSDDRRRYRRQPRRGRRGYPASVRSVVSSTSLLDTMIAEETDADLLEHEESAPYELARSQSAPMELRSGKGSHWQQHIDLGDHATVSSFGSSLFQPSNALSDTEMGALNNIQLAPVSSLRRSRSLDGGRSFLNGVYGDEYGPDSGTHQSDRMVSSPDSTFDTHREDPVESISFSSAEQIHGYRKRPNEEADKQALVDKEDEVKPDPVGTVAADQSFSSEVSSNEQECTIPFEKCTSPSSTVHTVPETPSPDTSRCEHAKQQDLSTSYESERSWKEEKRLKGGIHASPMDDFDVSSSSEDEEGTSIRETRIRRLQRQRELLKRPRLKPETKNTAPDTLDLQLIEVLRPDGVEYGPDEESL